MEKKGQEDSLINAFNRRFDRLGATIGREVACIATNGDDRHVLADYLFADEANWVFVEFKSWADSGQSAERRKTKSRLLCSKLASVSNWRSLHDAGHFAGYGRDSSIEFNIYRCHFCGGCKPSVVPMTDRQFLQAFSNGEIGLAPSDADAYIQWLMKLDAEGTDGRREFELLIDIGDGDLMMKPFSSAVEASLWISEVQAARNQPLPPSGIKP